MTEVRTPPHHDLGTTHGPIAGNTTTTTTTTTTTFSNYASLAALLLTTPYILAFYYMIFLTIYSVLSLISVNSPPLCASLFSLPLPFLFSLCVYLQSPIIIFLLPYFFASFWYSINFPCYFTLSSSFLSIYLS